MTREDVEAVTDRAIVEGQIGYRLTDAEWGSFTNRYGWLDMMGVAYDALRDELTDRGWSRCPECDEPRYPATPHIDHEAADDYANARLGAEDDATMYDAYVADYTAMWEAEQEPFCSCGHDRHEGQCPGTAGTMLTMTAEAAGMDPALPCRCTGDVS